MAEKNINILKNIARQVYSAVNPLLGTAESKKTVGLGFGGDETSFIDEVAEKTILDYLIQHEIYCIFVVRNAAFKDWGRNRVSILSQTQWTGQPMLRAA